MTHKEAKQVKIGSRLRSRNDPNASGTVDEIARMVHMVHMTWDDGSRGWISLSIMVFA